jgi:hypothetical protein
MISPEVAFENPPHAQSLPANRTISWSHENDSFDRKCKARINFVERSDSILVCRFQSANRGSHGFVGSVVCYLAQHVTFAERNVYSSVVNRSCAADSLILGSLQSGGHGVLGRLKENGVIRLILRTERTFACFQERNQSVELARLERATKGWHVRAAIEDADDQIVAR